MVFAIGQWAKARGILKKSMIEKAYVALNRLLIDIWILTTLPMRTPREVRSIAWKHICFKEYKRHHK